MPRPAQDHEDHEAADDEPGQDNTVTTGGEPVAALGTVRVVAPEPGDPFDPVEPDAGANPDPDGDDGAEAEARAQLAAWGVTPDDLERLRIEVADQAKDKARAENKAGLRRHRKLELAKAVERYQAALAAWPAHPYANYNLACAHALRGERDLAIRYLAVLFAVGDETSQARLRSARTDADFDSIRKDVDYQRITRYLEAQVAWSPALESDRDARDVIDSLREDKIPAVDAGSWHQDMPRTTLFVAKGDPGAAALADEIEASADFELKRVESTYLDMARPLVLVVGRDGLATDEEAEAAARPADFVGKALTARVEGAEEHLTLKGTGFFSWERIQDNGTRVTRSGRYLLEKGTLSLDFRQVTETPAAGGGQPDVAVEQGRRTTHKVVAEGRALLVDGVRFEGR